MALIDTLLMRGSALLMALWMGLGCQDDILPPVPSAGPGLAERASDSGGTSDCVGDATPATGHPCEEASYGFDLPIVEWDGCFVVDEGGYVSHCVIDKTLASGCNALLGTGPRCPTFDEMLDLLGWGTALEPPTPGAVVEVYSCDDGFTLVRSSDSTGFGPQDYPVPDLLEATFDSTGEMTRLYRSFWNCCGSDDAVWCCDGTHMTNRLVWGPLPDPYVCVRQLRACRDFGRCSEAHPPSDPEPRGGACGCDGGAPFRGAVPVLLSLAIGRRRRTSHG